MKTHHAVFASLILLFLAAPALFAQPQSIDVQLNPPFRFVAYGDTRFHDPSDHKNSNPSVRQALVQAIDEAHPAFISIGGDLVYKGDDASDWATWDTETSIWRQHNIPVYPAIGNHELAGDPKRGLAYFFQRFPELRESHYYSVGTSNTLLLVLDSSQDETTGAQGVWLANKLGHLPPNIDFVFFSLHHPPYTSSSLALIPGSGHAARPAEQALAAILEERQQHTRARFIVFASHVHNYERHTHNGVTYFVTGGGAANAYPIPRAPEDPFQSNDINYHYLLVEIDHTSLKITMNRIDFSGDKPIWTQPDFITITAPAALPGKVAAASN